MTRSGELPFPPGPRWLMSVEEECLTSVPGADEFDDAMPAVEELFRTLRGLAPTVPATSGFFNPYGKFYPDCGHVELAAMECGSPYELAAMVERQHRLVAEALAIMAGSGTRLLLANNNYSGLLNRSSPTWGSHENHLVERPPQAFTELILPFLVTRIYGGAGGVHFPSGRFLAGARPEFITRPTGGGTTSDRAIHSTAREEHLMGPRGSGYRYHLILGDGHRSQFNLALQFGATSLAVKAAIFDPHLGVELRDCGLPLKNSWVTTLKQLNVLAGPGDTPRAAPHALRVQRVYLRAAERWTSTLDAVPAWIPRLLTDWRETLDAMAAGDRTWLAARLDAFAKYELFSAHLQAAGRRWRDLRRHKPLFAELALLDHDYHTFGDPGSAFERLEQAGLLEHRVGPVVAPGGEPEMFVPDTTTRARARALFLREHAGQTQLLMDWHWVLDRRRRRVRELHDPFAADFGPWRRLGDDEGLAAGIWHRRPRPRPTAAAAEPEPADEEDAGPAARAAGA